MGHPIKRRSIRRCRRGGYVLVLVVLLLFGIMAMAALVIDIGFVRLTQRQMQTAVDAASLEGLRYRDGLWPEATGANLDVERRNAASLTAARMFDDNLLADAADPWDFGAGPIVEFSGGAGDPDLVASEFIFDPDNPNPDPKIGSLPKVPVYKPNDTGKLRNNLTNVPDGDMLDGIYATRPGPTATSQEIRDFHKEKNDYSREDFTRPPLPLPSIYPAFLVRMRRSNENFAVSDTASNGPALPYLFARGSLFNRSDDTEQAKLSDGIQLRATAIAHAQPVVCVGRRNDLLNIPGRLGVAVELTIWNAATSTPSIPYSQTFAVTGDVIGEQVLDERPSVTAREGYVAIFRDIARPDADPPFADFRVIGFGHATVDENGEVTKMSTGVGQKQIARENASSVFCYAPRATGPDLASVIAANRALASRTDILLAPVSGR